jgi:hypothetical protein
MLVKFYTVEFDESHSIPTAITLFGDDIPHRTCLIFSKLASKYVFCIDASIDAEQIFSQNGFSSVFVHDLDVPIENYSNKYSIGVDFEHSTYYLYEINLPIVDPSLNILP